MSGYTLMHKDIPVLDCMFQDGYVTDITRVYESEHIPVGCLNILNRADTNLFRDWWNRRSVPSTRANLKDIQLSLCGASLQDLCRLNFGCSLSDQYWMKPQGADLKYGDVNFFQNDFESDLTSIFLSSKQTEGQFDVMTPSCSTGGDVPKTWVIHNGHRYLCKASGTTFGQEPYNEEIASQLNDVLGIDHVKYRVHSFEETVCSVCPCMIDENQEIITAYDITRSMGQFNSNNIAYIKDYIKFAEEQGIDIKKSISEMVISDFLMRNTDRHWSNFGLIRDANTLEYIKAVPMFDYGNSLFHNQAVISEKARVFSKFSGLSLSQDLRYATDIKHLHLDNIKMFSDIVRSVVEKSDLPRDRKLKLCDFAKYQADRMFEYFGVQKQNGGAEHEL